MTQAAHDKALDDINQAIHAIVPKIAQVGIEHGTQAVRALLTFVLLNIFVDGDGKLPDDAIEQLLASLGAELRRARDTNNFVIRSIQ